MPILRARAQSYVSRIWNVHPIRRQTNRPHIVPGKPIMNYYYPTSGIPDCKEAFDPSILQRYNAIINSSHSMINLSYSMIS